MTSLYRNIIKRAWDITKRYKFLWFLGLFAAILGNVSEYQALFTQLDRINNQPQVYQSIIDTLIVYSQILYNIGQLPLTNILAIILTLLFVLLVIVVVAWLAVSSQVGIISATDKVHQNKKPTFKKSFLTGTKHFWPALGLNVIAKLITFLLLTLIITPIVVVLVVQNSAWSVFWSLVSVIIFVPISIIVNFVTKYAIAFLVLKGQAFWESFKNGWRLFAANWVISIEMGLITLIINLALAFILSLIAIIVASPLLIIGLTTASAQLFYVLFGFAMTLVAIIFIFGGAVFSAWQNSAWTLLFIKLNSGKFFPKIVRLIAHYSRRKR